MSDPSLARAIPDVERGRSCVSVFPRCGKRPFTLPCSESKVAASISVGGFLVLLDGRSSCKARLNVPVSTRAVCEKISWGRPLTLFANHEHEYTLSPTLTGPRIEARSYMLITRVIATLPSPRGRDYRRPLRTSKSTFSHAV